MHWKDADHDPDAVGNKDLDCMWCGRHEELCAAHKYAESAAVNDIVRERATEFTQHNYLDRWTSFSIVISLSGARNSPRCNVIGAIAVSASSFSVGSARR